MITRDDLKPILCKLSRHFDSGEIDIIENYLIAGLGKGKEGRGTMPFGFYTNDPTFAPPIYRNLTLDALHEKIAKQDKTLREYEKKMSQMGDTILRLRKWVDRINALQGVSADELCQTDPPKEERICVECAHVVRVNTAGQWCTKCNRHKNVVTGEDISCDMARGVNIPDFEGHDDCGPEGKFWAPKEEPRYGMCSDGTSWATKDGGAGG